jgi:short-subunit dehydrogenase
VKARIVNISSWAGALGQPFIPFYNASKFAITGLTESMFYDLGLLDVHVVLASPGTTKTPLLGKTTRAGTESLARMTPEGRARYQPLLDHYATLSVQYGSSPLFQTPEQAAKKLLRIVDTKRPRFRYDLSIDACVVNRFIARFVPWTLKVAMNRSMFPPLERQGPYSERTPAVGRMTPPRAKAQGRGRGRLARSATPESAQSSC